MLPLNRRVGSKLRGTGSADVRTLARSEPEPEPQPVCVDHELSARITSSVSPSEHPVQLLQQAAAPVAHASPSTGASAAQHTTRRRTLCSIAYGDAVVPPTTIPLWGWADDTSTAAGGGSHASLAAARSTTARQPEPAQAVIHARADGGCFTVPALQSRGQARHGATDRGGAEKRVAERRLHDL